MPRFYGKIGFGRQVEKRPGVWLDEISERDYYGDVLNVTRYREESDNVNDNVRLQQRLSIVADPFVNDNVYAIKYVRWAGSLWTVTAVEIQRPRLILTLGGVYDGPKAPEAANVP